MMNKTKMFDVLVNFIAGLEFSKCRGNFLFSIFVFKMMIGLNFETRYDAMLPCLVLVADV